MPVPKPEIAVAAVILEQLGGRLFLRMTGARYLLAHPSALTFRLRSNFARNGINHVRIELNAEDLYDTTWSRVRSGKMLYQETMRDIYCDQLRNVFTSVTGLDTSL